MKHKSNSTAARPASYYGWVVASIFLILFAGLGPSPARAIIFYDTADPNANTTAPGGALRGSGWDLQGNWGDHLGTPISSQFFLTAKHLPGTVGDIFTLNGVDYTTTAVIEDADSDLALWQISGTFPSFAPLYTTSDEVTKSMVVFGRGLSRGTEVNVSSDLKGWEWEAGTGMKRWGENVVSDISTIVGVPGTFLQANFDQTGGPNEAHLAGGDSGGGLFILDGGEWKLAGVNYGVDGPYATLEDGATFNAAIFDEGGLYKENVLISDDIGDIPGGFYSTRISDRLDWINGAVPEPHQYAMMAGFSLVLFGLCRRWFLLRKRPT